MTFSEKLRALMTERGIGVRELARMLPYDKGNLSRVVNGRKPPSENLATLLDEVLGANGELVALRSSSRARQAPSAHRTTTSTAAPSGGAADALFRRIERMSPGEIEELLHHLADYWHVLVKADNLLGPQHALDGVLAQLDILRALRTHARPPLRDLALHLAAQYAESAAWLYEDARDLEISRLWTGRAMEWALEVGDQQMVAWTLFRRSQQAQADGNGMEVIGLAEAARRQQGDVPGPMLAAILQQLAHGHALDGSETTCHSILDEALGHAASTDNGDARSGHGAFCTPAYLEMQRGRCWLILGHPARAASSFQVSVQELPLAYQRDKAVAYAGLAAALAAQEQPERAAQRAIQALTVARSSGSRRILAMLTPVATSLAPHEHLDSVAEFLTGLADTQAA